MKRWLLFTMVVSGLAFSLAASAQAKPRVAVLKIRNESAYGSARLGPAIEDWLVEGLVQSGKFRVVERKELDSILQEQGLSLSGAVDDKTAVQVGKLLGCQVVIMGAVTDFSRHKSGAHGAWGIGFNVGTTKAEGTLNVRMVNTTTAEIIYTGNAKGEHSFSNVDVAGFGGGVDWDESQARQIFEPAVRQVVAAIVAKVDEIKDSLGSAAVTSGKVAKVSEGKVYISIGSTDGVKEGDQFSLFHLGEAITDPDTGKVLGQDKTRVGTLTVSKVVGEHLSIGVVDGGGQVQVGDLVAK
jgi:curli biogenesis system outer membrane secretion channel CsgG